MPFNSMHQCSSSCAAICGGIALLWILLSSGLLMATWNKVVSELFKMKKVNYWQALLVLFTIAVLCAPAKMGRGCGKGGACPYDHASKEAATTEAAPH